MHRHLQIHLSEQLALLTGLAALGRRTLDQNRDPPFSAPLDATVRECEADREALAAVMRALSLSRSRSKEAAAVLAERLGRLKLNGQLTGYSPLSRLMEITGLQAGAAVRSALWTDLEALSRTLLEIDAGLVAERHRAAEEDRARLEGLRVVAAELAFGR